MKQASLFVTFEGIDGCGKSTHVALAHRWLVQWGYNVATLREPGTTDVAEQIRRLLLDKKMKMTPVTELLLYEAARADITARQIAPLLKRNQIVLCDRYFDSTTAYQGYGRKLDIKMVKFLHSVAVGPVRPDLTLLFDVDLATAFARRGKELDRLESEPRAFFKRVRAGFLEIARRERSRVKVIDAARPIEVVFEDVKRHLKKKLAIA
ncbi:MAG: dTMP kinase [Candidatus Zixiibacteriota bacterium]